MREKIRALESELAVVKRALPRLKDVNDSNINEKVCIR